eukprot:TRINITY_DN34843_c0_g1_i1.p1 TRINITY_DN34843_c0_g1~~TRINITY_DN34843_c0_g1_i1.p1  ORF type:complete len:610 (+),score=99.50 TRINITY_DN34843_c0_g1_i1:55-1830(+)
MSVAEELEQVNRGPMVVPSRVAAGVYRITGALFGGVGNTTIGLGSTVEGVVAETSKLAQDSVKLLGEPTRAIGHAIQSSKKSTRWDPAELADVNLVRQEDVGAGARYYPPSSLFTRSVAQTRRPLMERIARRCLTEAFGDPSEQAVMLAPPLAMALVAAWLVGRYGRRPLPWPCGSANDVPPDLTSPSSGTSPVGLPSSNGSIGSTMWSRQKIWRKFRRRFSFRVCFVNVAALMVIFVVVIRSDEHTTRRRRIVEGLSMNEIGESAHWFNHVFKASWSPLLPNLLNERTASAGLAGELAAYAKLCLDGAGEVLTYGVELLDLGSRPPVLDAFRKPSREISALLLDALSRARENCSTSERGQAHGELDAVSTRVILLEADLSWASDSDGELRCRVNATSTVQSSIARKYLPYLRIRMKDFLLGPAAVAIAFEAAPQGYPYVGMMAITFVSAPRVDFSLTTVDGGLGGAITAVPLVRAAITESISELLPVASNQEVGVFNLGEYLAPGLFRAQATLGEAKAPSASAGGAAPWEDRPEGDRSVVSRLPHVQEALLEAMEPGPGAEESEAKKPWWLFGFRPKLPRRPNWLRWKSD